MSTTQWFYRTGDTECGPVAVDELRFLVQSGKILRSTMVRSSDSARWLPLLETNVVTAVGTALKRPSGRSAPPARFQKKSVTSTETEATGANTSGANATSVPPVPPQHSQKSDDRRKIAAGIGLGLLMLLLTWFLWPQEDDPSGMAGTGSGSGSGDFGTEQASADGSSENPVGDGIATESSVTTAGQDSQLATNAATADSSSNDSSASDSAADATSAARAIDAATAEDEQMGIESDVIAEDEPGLATGADDASRFSVSAPGETTFFGIRGAGRRFAYVVDCSGSMQGEPLVRAKQELLESINKLPAHVEFRIVFFDDLAYQFPTSGEFSNADQDSREAAENWVTGINSGGGTNVKIGMSSVLSTGKNPDSVFLLTDGQFEDDTPQYLKSINRDKARVNTIAFVTNLGEPLLRRIASDNRGDFRFVP